MATGAITFNEVASNIRVPGVYMEISNAAAGYSSSNLVAIIIGQPTITATSQTPALVTTVDAAIATYGAGSQLSRMIQTFVAENPTTTLYALPLNDNGTTKSTTTCTFAGTATAAGTIFLYINDDQIQVPVSTGDTATIIGGNVAAAVNANVLLPATAANGAGVVTFTSKNAGTVGNGITYQVNYLGNINNEYLPAGVTATFAAGVTGATDPTLATALANMGDIQFEYIVQPYTDSTSLTALRNFLALRWGPTKQLFGHAFTALKGTSSTLTTFGSALNDSHLTVVGYNGSPTWSIEVAAAVGAKAAFELSNDPALTLQTVALATVFVPHQTTWFTYTELNTLLYNGITPLNYVGGYARIVRLITTYQKNAYNLPDPSYLDVTTLATNARLEREAQYMILQKFPRCKLAADGTKFGAGNSIVTPSIIRGELLALYDEWIFKGWVQGKDDFAEQLIVTINPSDPNRVDVLLPPYLVGNLVVTAIRNEFRLKLDLKLS